VTTESDALGELVGAELSAVTFVRDYLQLQFDSPSSAPILNAYTPVTVRSGSREAIIGDDAFPALIVAQINKQVTQAQVFPGEAVEIGLTDGSRILISLRAQDYVGAEAINLRGRDGNLLVM